MSSNGLDLDAALREHVPVEFHVLADLENARVLQQRLQQFERDVLGDLSRRQPAAAEEIALAFDVANRNVTGLARRDRKRNADEIGLDRIERRGLGVERDDPGLVARARSSG